jgi:hypothetical protein
VHRSDRFCGNCGYKLSLASTSPTRELSFDEKLAKIQRYLPKGLTEKVLSQRDRIEGERVPRKLMRSWIRSTRF